MIFLNIKVGYKKEKRAEIELFKDKAPIISEFFRCFCTGVKDKKMNYKRNIYNRVIKNFIIQGGYSKNENAISHFL